MYSYFGSPPRPDIVVMRFSLSGGGYGNIQPDEAAESRHGNLTRPGRVAAAARLCCELARHGFPGPRSRPFADAVKRRAQWRWLLKINDDSALYNDSWADGGSIAFMILDDDLAARRFDSCWCILSSS